MEILITQDEEQKKVALKAQIAVFTLETDYPSKTYV